MLVALTAELLLMSRMGLRMPGWLDCEVKKVRTRQEDKRQMGSWNQ